MYDYYVMLYESFLSNCNNIAIIVVIKIFLLISIKYQYLSYSPVLVCGIKLKRVASKTLYHIKIMSGILAESEYVTSSAKNPIVRILVRFQFFA